MTYERDSLIEEVNIDKSLSLLERLQKSLCSEFSLEKDTYSILNKQDNPREGSIEVAKPNSPVKISAADIVRSFYTNEGFIIDNNGNEMINVRRGLEKYFIFITERDSSYKLNIMKTVL